MWIYIVDMHFHILADVFFFDNMNYSSKLFNPTSFVIEPYLLPRMQGQDSGISPSFVVCGSIENHERKKKGQGVAACFFPSSLFMRGNLEQ